MDTLGSYVGWAMGTVTNTVEPLKPSGDKH